MAESAPSKTTRPAPTPGRPYAVTVLFTAIVFLALAAAVATPLVYESTTLWYKFGTGRILLLAGQMIGLLTLVLLGLQILLMARFALLDRIIGRSRVLPVHRRLGLLILVLALLHPLLILVPEGLSNLPIGWKYWPEMVGACSLALLGLHVAAAYFRTGLGMSYPLWRRLHQLIGYTIFLAVHIHILFVSTSFAQGPPRYALYLYSGVILSAVFLRKAYALVRRSSAAAS